MVSPVGYAAIPDAAHIKPGRDSFTTGQSAKLLGVAPRTIAKWFDGGRLVGYRIPGSTDRRVPRAELIRFAASHGIPLKIDRDAVAVLAPPAAGFAPATVLRLGGLMVRAEVGSLLIGCNDGLAAAVALAREVRAIDPTVRLTLLLGEDRGPEDVPPGTFDEVRS